MSQSRVLVLRAAGVNCELETAHAWSMVGAAADVLHINALRESPGQLERYDILTIPGGFSYGDDIAAGRIFASQLQQFLGDTLQAFCERERLVLGICNGFQVLCKCGLLPGHPNLPGVTIGNNTSGKYEDRWVHLQVPTASPCKFLQPGAAYRIPVAHGEGRVVVRNEQDTAALDTAGCVALRYVSGNGRPVGYPDNPNGSADNIAGLCDPTGRIFGLMPHPERFMHLTQHPEWTGGDVESADGLLLFDTAVKAVSS